MGRIVGQIPDRCLLVDHLSVLQAIILSYLHSDIEYCKYSCVGLCSLVIIHFLNSLPALTSLGLLEKSFSE